MFDKGLCWCQCLVFRNQGQPVKERIVLCLYRPKWYEQKQTKEITIEYGIQFAQLSVRGVFYGAWERQA